MKLSGKCSWFGGPLDRGVDPDEGLALYSSVDQAPWLFMSKQPPGTTGLARRLNPSANFIACRWDYDQHSKEYLRKHFALVRAHLTGNVLVCFPVDWGPGADTSRVADLSMGALQKLGIKTDDVVDVVFPAEEGLIA